MEMRIVWISRLGVAPLLNHRKASCIKSASLHLEFSKGNWRFGQILVVQSPFTPSNKDFTFKIKV